MVKIATKSAIWQDQISTFSFRLLSKGRVLGAGQLIFWRIINRRIADLEYLRMLHNENDYSRFETFLPVALHRSPHGVKIAQLVRQVVYALLQTDNIDRARAIIAAASTLSPRSDQLLEAQVECAEAAEDAPELRRIALKICKPDVSKPEVARKVAVALVATASPGSSLPVVQLLRDRYPRLLKVRESLVQMHFAAGRNAEALKELDLLFHSTKKLTFQGYVDWLISSDKFNTAQAVLSVMVRHFPDRIGLRKKLMQLSVSNGDIENIPELLVDGLEFLSESLHREWILFSAKLLAVSASGVNVRDVVNKCESFRQIYAVLRFFPRSSELLNQADLMHVFSRYGTVHQDILRAQLLPRTERPRYLITRHGRLSEDQEYTTALFEACYESNQWSQYADILVREADRIHSINSDDKRAQNIRLVRKITEEVGDGQLLLDSPDVVASYANTFPFVGPAPDEPRVAYVGGQLGGGGAEKQFVDLYNHLRRSLPDLNIDVYLHSIDSDKGHDFYLDRIDAEVDEIILYGHCKVTCPSHSLDFLPEGLFDLLPNGMGRRATSLYKYFVERKPTVVHAWQDMVAVEAAIAARLAGVQKVIMHTHRMSSLSFVKADTTDSFSGVYNILVRNKSYSVVCCAAACAEDYRRWIGLQDCNAIAYVHNGFDVDIEDKRRLLRQKSKIRVQLGIRNDEFLIGTAFRITDVKRPEFWVDTAALINKEKCNARFIVFGDGERMEDMRSRVAEHGLSGKFIFTGRVKDLDCKLSALDVFMLSSEVEGLPNVLIEAQLNGVPVATVDVGGCAETINPGITGIVATENSPKGLSSAALEVCALIERGEFESEEAIRWASRKFTISQMGSSFLQLYGLGRI